MSVPLLSELREPPAVGRFYMVPVVERYPWHRRTADWPVLGPLHDDLEFFDFGEPHYHIDIRFVGERMLRYIASWLYWQYRTEEVERDAALAATGWPLCNRDKPPPKGRPPLRRLMCRRQGIGSDFLAIARPETRDGMRARYGSPAEPIRRRDGRLLCPHRKVDLSSFAPDADGIVICPLHGLRVRCSPAASTAPVPAAVADIPRPEPATGNGSGNGDGR